MIEVRGKVVPVVGDIWREKSIAQYARNKAGDHDRSSGIDCVTKTSEALRDQPPVESHQRNFGEVQPRVEEVDRHEYDLAANTCQLTRLVAYLEGHVFDVLSGIRRSRSLSPRPEDDQSRCKALL